MLRLFVLSLLAAFVGAPSARAADDSACVSVAKAFSFVYQRANGGEVRRLDLTLPQIDFARGVYASAPPAGDYPKGSHATLARLPDDTAAIVFHGDGMSCGTIWIPPELTKTLIDFDQTEQAP